MTVILAAPTAALATQAALWGRTRATLTLWDGSKWDVSDPASGLFIERGSVVGLGMPPIEKRRTSSASEPGSRFRSSRVSERPVLLPLYLFSDDGSEAWLERDGAFWAGMHPDRTFTLSIEVPGRSARHLTLRFDGDDDAYDRDPVHFGWARYVVEAVAEQPFWTGDPIVRSWEPDEGSDFFIDDPANPQDLFFISSGFTLENAQMDNPGDVESYAVWDIDALGEEGITSVTVGVSGRLTTAPFLIPQDQGLTIDPRPGPRGKSAYDSFGNRRTPELSARDFAPIPAGSSVPLSLAMVGQGRVTATLVPLFFRAWG